MGSRGSFDAAKSGYQYGDFYHSTNTEGGGLDHGSGVFTAPHPGTYTVWWSLSAENDSNENEVGVVLRKNGADIAETFHQSYLKNENPSSQADLGI